MIFAPRALNYSSRPKRECIDRPWLWTLNPRFVLVHLCFNKLELSSFASASQVFLFAWYPNLRWCWTNNFSDCFETHARRRIFGKLPCFSNFYQSSSAHEQDRGVVSKAGKQNTGLDIRDRGSTVLGTRNWLAHLRFP